MSCFFHNVFGRRSPCVSVHLQPELHLPQRGGPADLRPQRGADHGAATLAHASHPAAAPTPAPPQPHVPGLLRLGSGHGGGELGGGGEDGRARAGDPAASRHGVLPELPGPLPGEDLQSGSFSLGKKKLLGVEKMLHFLFPWDSNSRDPKIYL